MATRTVEFSCLARGLDLEIRPAVVGECQGAEADDGWTLGWKTRGAGLSLPFALLVFVLVMVPVVFVAVILAVSIAHAAHRHVIENGPVHAHPALGEPFLG